MTELRAIDTLKFVEILAEFKGLVLGIGLGLGFAAVNGSHGGLPITTSMFTSSPRNPLIKSSISLPETSLMSSANTMASGKLYLNVLAGALSLSIPSSTRKPVCLKPKAKPPAPQKRSTRLNLRFTF